MPKTTAVVWDISELFAGPDDPRVDQCLDALLARARQFAKAYRNKIDNKNLNAETFLAAIRNYEDIVRQIARISSCAALLFASDTSKPERGAFMQRIQKRETDISLELMFFGLELMAAKPEIIDPLARDEALKDYRHFIHASRLFRDHRLSESEEKLLEEKANTGSRAFERLFEEMVSAIEFKITLDGKEKTLTEAEVLALLRDPSREVRQAAAASFTEGLRKNGRLLTYIFNTLVFDKAVDDRLRRYQYPDQSRNIANELDGKTVETVISTCSRNYPLVARYYRTKRKILGLDTLMHYDRHAPLFEAKREYSFEEARGIILESFGGFSKDMSDIAAEFFDGHWIDAQPRKGKRGGAFCEYVTPDHHPYIMLSYLNGRDDVIALAHELGHGVHACLSRHQTYLNFRGVLPIAELASTFGEMLVFEALVDQAELEEKLVLYAGKIEGIFVTAFRQAALFQFEQELHSARRQRGELTCDEIGAMWQSTTQAMFGDSVIMGPGHENWWMNIDLFLNSPFYVYAYPFGALVVMALYSMYRREGKSFVPRYMELLRTGGSCSPREMLRGIGIDINDRDFWSSGMKLIEELVDRFEKLHSEWEVR